MRDSTLLHFAMAYSNGDKDFEWATDINRIMLKIIGLWPPDNQDARKILQSKLRLLYHLVTLLFVLTIPALVSLIRVWGNMILMIDNLQYSLPLLMTIVKICIIWNKQKVNEQTANVPVWHLLIALAPLIDMIVRDWTKVKIKDERDVMLKHARITRIISMCGVIIVCCASFFCFVLPCFGITIRHVTNLTDPGKPLLIQSYYLHDVSKSPQYELTLLAQGIGVFSTAVSYYAIDHFLGLLIIHVCGQMKNLHSRLSHMDKYPDFHATLKYIIEDHIRLIRSVQIIDSTFDIMLLGLVLYFGIQFCLQGFLIINFVNQKGQLSFMQLSLFVAPILSVLLHMCLYCAAGELLVTQSEKIYHASYDYAWYTIEPRSARNLMLIMLRAQKPLHITAGKMFPMTMAMFCNLLKTSAGYVSVLLANQN